MTHDLSAMSWIEAGKVLSSIGMVIIPVGSFEQHGLHLGLGTDWIIAWELSRRVGERTNIPVLPVLPYGVAVHHMDFPGTITLSPNTFRAVLMDILESLSKHGVSKVLFINGHGGNLNSLLEVCRYAREKFGILCVVCQWWDILSGMGKTILGQPAQTHAGYAETALMLALKPEAVNLNYAILSSTKQVHDKIQLESLNSARFMGGIIRISLKTSDVSDTGSMTEVLPNVIPDVKDFSKVNVELGMKLVDELVDWFCKFIEAFKTFNIKSHNVSEEDALKSLRGG
ncbi:MAG: creatininase family protein [Candidatus Methanomethylicia archaeon]